MICWRQTLIQQNSKEIGRKVITFEHSSRKEPASFREAMSSKERAHWLEAIESELDAMNENQVCSIVDRPVSSKGKRPNIIDSRWVLKRKLGVNGEIKHKAGFVCRGFKDRNDYELDETYAPVSRMQIIRATFAIINKLDFEVCQLDVKTAFSNGTLESEVFMEIQEGLNCSDEVRKNKICKLERALYGLKVSPKRWNEKFTQVARKLSLTTQVSEPCLFTWRENKKFLLLLLYVDDMLIASNDSEKMHATKTSLMLEFKMTDLGAPLNLP
ncbi:hypothetical protein TKK_0018613 [Trichogramma kaykai]